MEESEDTADSAEGTLRFEVDKVSKLDRYDHCWRISTNNIERLNGVLWFMRVKKETSDREEDYLVFSLYGVNDDDKETSIDDDIDAECRILHPDGHAILTDRISFKYDSKNRNHFPIPWEILIEKGCIINDTVMAEIHFKISNGQSIHLKSNPCSVAAVPDATDVSVSGNHDGLSEYLSLLDPIGQDKDESQDDWVLPAPVNSQDDWGICKDEWVLPDPVDNQGNLNVIKKGLAEVPSSIPDPVENQMQPQHSTSGRNLPAIKNGLAEVPSGNFENFGPIDQDEWVLPAPVNEDAPMLPALPAPVDNQMQPQHSTSGGNLPAIKNGLTEVPSGNFENFGAQDEWVLPAPVDYQMQPQQSTNGGNLNGIRSGLAEVPSGIPAPVNNQIQPQQSTNGGNLGCFKNGLAFPSGYFENFEKARAPHQNETLLRTLAPCELQLWCAVMGDPPLSVEWNSEKCPVDLRNLRIFDHRIDIRKEIMSADVTILIAPCGTGKSLITPALLAEILKEDAANGKRSKSRRGLTICPTSGHGNETAKRSETLYMLNPDSLCDIANFTNQFERIPGPVEEEYKEKFKIDRSPRWLLPSTTGAPMHAITNYRGGVEALKKTVAGDAEMANSHRYNEGTPNLKLVQIDEVHSTTTELNSLLALARQQMALKNVEKLLLTSATLDEGEIGKLRSFFEKALLSVAVVDLSPKIGTQCRLKMSCALLKNAEEKGEETGPFDETELSKAITEDFSKPDLFERKWEYSKRVQWEYTNENLLEILRDEECEEVPEMNNMEGCLMGAIDRGMEQCVKRRHPNGTMPSIQVHIAGKEIADRIMSAVKRGSYGMKGKYRHRDLKKETFFEFLVDKRTKKPLFVAERLKSKAAKSAVKGGQGRIILATHQRAEGLTQENVALVIDPGVIRIPGAYNRNGLRHLDLTWIDRRLLLLRAGRSGRTCSGEYFICVTGEKLARILKDDIKEKLMTRDFDEIAWIRAKQLGVFEDLIYPPPDYLISAFMQSFEIRGLWNEQQDKFTMEAKQLMSYFNFLTPDLARFVVMGVRLGLAAHTIAYVAEHTSSHKLSGRPTNIRENYFVIADSHAYEAYVNVSALAPDDGIYEDLRPYDMGDSIVKADMVVTWLRHTFPPIVTPDPLKPKPARPTLNIELEPNFDKYEPNNDERWKEMEALAAKAPDGYFWCGRWCEWNPVKKVKKDKFGKIVEEVVLEEDKRGDVMGMRTLQEVFIRDEGREAVCSEVSRLTHACQRLRIIFAEDDIDGRGSIFAPRFNRYIRGKDNYNLNEDGRALFRALLTMCSDKLANAVTIKSTYAMFNIQSPGAGYGRDTICPERRDWKEREQHSTVGLIRYWEAFKATHATMYTGCLDPISEMQAAFFLNAFGKVEKNDKSLNIHLNASPSKCPDGIKPFPNGISIQMDEEMSRNVSTVRDSLIRSAARVCTERENMFGDITRAIIDLWKDLDDGVEEKIQMLPEWEKKRDKMAIVLGRDFW